MLYGIYRIKQILDRSGFMFNNPNVDMETLKRVNAYDLSYDFLEMYRMLSDIKIIIDKIVQEEDENENIDKLMQEGEDHEL